MLRLSLAALVAATTVTATIFSSKPDVTITSAFAPDNTLSQVKNGHRNTLFLSITNHEATPYSLDLVTGSFREPAGKERPLRNTTASTYSLTLPPKAKEPLVVPYHFYSEFKPQDLLLTVWVEVSPVEEGIKAKRNRKAKDTTRLSAFEGQVSIVESPVSWFDPLLLLSYLVALAFLTGLVYFTAPIVQSWFASPTSGKSTTVTKKRSVSRTTPKKKDISSPVESLGPKYDVDFIPPQHLKKQPSKAKVGAEATSGSEAEGTDGGAGVGRTTRRRKR